MRLVHTFLCAVMALGWFAGCEKEQPAAPPQERLKAAKAIRDPGNRDSALVKVAKAAAAAGEGEVVQEALSNIRDPGLHDSTAAACAPQLMKAGKGSEATEVAKSIRDPGIRDSVLSKLADGK